MFNLWSDPTLVPGCGQYEKYDPGWAELLFAYQGSDRAIFPQGGTVIDVPDTLKLVLAGDWGTATEPAVSTIRSLMLAEHADFTIHLGDVYYAGEPSEEAAFASAWPAGAMGSLALNSNHEMYGGGFGYLQTLANPKFAAQGGKTYFALRNSRWLIVGLDTARSSTSFLYKDGALDMAQLAWLDSLVGGRHLILMSHHDGFNLACLDDAQFSTSTAMLYKPLWEQLKPYPRHLWYWGHVHSPIVFTGARCVGHGGVPYLPFHGNPRLYGDHDVSVEWVETDIIAGSQRAPSGFAVLRLDGLAVQEQFVDELGRARWQTSYRVS